MSPLRALRDASGDTPGGTDEREHERRLVRRAAGDPDAFAALYRMHSPAIQRYLRRRLGDPHVVEDAVAETFLGALRAIGRYRDRGVPFRAWLYRIATGCAHRHLRRARALASDLLDEQPAPVEEGAPLSAELARAALLRLPDRYQSALALHYLEGLPVEEVARTLGVRVGTVKSRLARGRRLLRDRLESSGVSS